MKVVDLAVLSNFHKGHLVFFSTDFAQRLAIFECQLVSMNRRYCQLIKFFTFFLSKFRMPLYMKVVSLNKLDNFHKGRFLSV
jgi:hypothetical protein